MRRFEAVFPFVMAVVFGSSLQDLAWAIDTNAGIHSATDLSRWIVVAVSGIAAFLGARKAYKAAAPAKESSPKRRGRDGIPD